MIPYFLPSVQMEKAELSVCDNKWYQVFDFNAGESEGKNWSLVSENVSYPLSLYPSS